MISDQAGRAIIRYMSKLSAAFEELHRALEAVAFADVTSTEMQLKWQIELWRKYADDLFPILLGTLLLCFCCVFGACGLNLF